VALLAIVVAVAMLTLGALVRPWRRRR